MKKLFLFLTCLALASLACLQSAQSLSAYPTETATAENLVLAAVQDPTQDAPVVVPSPDGAGGICAEVIADQALHLRAEANEHALVLTWLKSGDQVDVIATDNAEWWLIDHQDLVGFARSAYLQEVDCEQ